MLVWTSSGAQRRTASEIACIMLSGRAEIRERGGQEPTVNSGYGDLLWGIAALAVFLALLIKFTRTTLVMVGIGVSCLLAWIGYQQWLAVERDSYERTERRKVWVMANSTLPAPECTPEKPVYVTFFNDSSRKVLAIEWDVQVTKRGHSTNLVAVGGVADMDQILEPGDRGYYCWGLPNLKEQRKSSELEVKAVITNVRFAD